jgi:hypothetical protein
VTVAHFMLGDTRKVVSQLPDGCVDLVVTSPPFLALRSYLPADHPDKHAEIGSEPDPATFLDMLLALTADWGRVLAPWGSIAIELGVNDYDWVHPATTITDSRWGIGTHINAGAIVIRTTIGSHCTISPGVTICGDVTIGDRVLVGAGAVISDRVTIGADATIGAGTVVLPQTVIGPGETWVGVPARPL